MVTVQKLISELKKMPQHLQVGVAMHDNEAHEVAAWVMDVAIDTDNEHTDDLSVGEIAGKTCVVLRC